MTVFAGTASRALAQAIERELGFGLGACVVDRFADGEVSVRLDEAVRAKDVVLVQATSPPVNDHLVELLALADACRRAAAARIAAVIPYFGYARSDRRDGQRAPIVASLVARLMEHAGIGQIVTVDVHTPALEGFFTVPADNLTASGQLASALRAHVPPGAVIVAPDFGAMRLANRYATHLDLSVAVCHKRRGRTGEVSVNRITGDVAGRACVIIDDMITTGATIAESARALRDAGALADITVAATHPVLTRGALERIAAAGVRRVFVTDTIPTAAGAVAGLDVRVVSVAPLLAEAIRRLAEGQPASLQDLT